MVACSTVSLAGTLVAGLEVRSCAGCVHLNPSHNRAGEGACTPVGWRGPAAEPCDQWFGLEQLQLGSYGRRS